MTKPDTSMAAVQQIIDVKRSLTSKLREAGINVVPTAWDMDADLFAALLAERDTLSEALDGLLIALSTGKGIAEATDTAKAAMRRATQGKE